MTKAAAAALAAALGQEGLPLKNDQLNADIRSETDTRTDGESVRGRERGRDILAPGTVPRPSRGPCEAHSRPSKHTDRFRGFFCEITALVSVSR